MSSYIANNTEDFEKCWLSVTAEVLTTLKMQNTASFQKYTPNK